MWSIIQLEASIETEFHILNLTNKGETISYTQKFLSQCVTCDTNIENSEQVPTSEEKFSWNSL